MKPLVFVAGQFFILGVVFTVFDPIGISFAIDGIIWILDRRLAALFLFYEFVARNWFSIMFVQLNLNGISPIAQSIIGMIGPFYFGACFLWGAWYGIGTLGKMIRSQLRKKAPDVLGMIGK